MTRGDHAHKSQLLTQPPMSTSKTPVDTSLHAWGPARQDHSLRSDGVRRDAALRRALADVDTGSLGPALAQVGSAPRPCTYSVPTLAD